MLASFLDDAKQVVVGTEKLPAINTQNPKSPALRSSVGARSHGFSPVSGQRRIGFSRGVKEGPTDEIDVPDHVEIGMAKVISVRGEDITPALWR